MNHLEQIALIAVAAASFPAEFGLRAFPGERFRVSLENSYVNDAGIVMLYTEKRWADGGWRSFAKGRVAQLMQEMTP